MMVENREQPAQTDQQAALDGVSSPGENNNAERQVQVFRRFDAKCADLSYKLASIRKYEEEAVIPGVGERDWERSQWESLLREAEALDFGRSCTVAAQRPFPGVLVGQDFGC